MQPVQLVFCWAPKLAKSVRVTIGFPVVRTDGGWSVYGHVITKFSGMGRFTYHSAPLARKRAPLKNWSFQVVVVQGQQRNVQKSVMYVQNCFAH